MPNQENTGGIRSSEKSAADTAEETITLESILREYDAKKAAAKSKEAALNAEKEAKAEADWEKIENELKKAVSDRPDETDDSDMKIVGETPNEPMFSVLSDSDASEKDSPAAEHKRDIMSEISRHFEEQEVHSEETEPPLTQKEAVAIGKAAVDAEAEADEAESSSDTADEEEPENIVSPDEAVAEEGNADEKPTRHSRKAIDNETLRRAFQKDGYDLYTRKGKKKKGADVDSAEKGDLTAASQPDGEYEKPAREKSRLFDENGERVQGESRYFSPLIEYTPDSGADEQLGFLRRRLLTGCLALLAVAVLFLVGLYAELAPTIGLPHPKVLEPGRFGRVYALFDLQILFFAVMVKLNGFCKGAAALSRRHPSSEAVAFVSVAAATLHTLAVVIFASTQSNPSLLCSVAAFSMLLLAVSDFLKARTEYMAFRIVSGDGDKVGFCDITASGETTSDEIVKFVPEGSKVLDVRKTDFAERFFERNCKPSPADRNTVTLITVSLIASLLGGVLYYLLNKELFSAFCGAVSVFMASVQSCILIASTVPESVFADRAARKKCAFIGHDLGDEYDNVSVISFKDTEVFSPKDVRVTNIRTYGDTRIDTMIVTMARIFEKIGGPLSSVFSNSISGITIENDNVTIVDVAPDGLWVKVDGDNAYIGTASYMAENNFEIISESADDSFRQTNGAILYLASSSRIMAKFYVKYTLSPGFESVLRSLYTQGICARIKTMDPCINNDFIRASLRRPECLFSVVKAQSPDEIDHTESTLSSGLISASGEHSLIQAFLSVRRMKQVMRLNGIIKIGAFAVGLFLSLLMLLGGSSVISPIAVLLMQVFWLIPMLVVTNLAEK